MKNNGLISLVVKILPILMVSYILVSCSNNEMKGQKSVSEDVLNNSLNRIEKTQLELEPATIIQKLEQTDIRVPLDILVVVDHSSSMDPYQNALSERLPALISFLDEDADWRIAVTSTTPSSVTDSSITNKECVVMDQEGRPLLIEAAEYRDPRMKQWTVEKYRNLIAMTATDRIVGYEEGLFKILEALNLVNKETYKIVKEKNPSLTTEVKDFKEQSPCPVWRRQDAKLVVLILSDEDHCSFNHFYTYSEACSIIDDTPISERQTSPKLRSDIVPEFQNLLKHDSFPNFPVYESNLPPRENRCISRKLVGSEKVDGKTTVNYYNFYYGTSQCRKYDSDSDKVDHLKPTSFTTGMTTRANSAKIFMDYLLQGVKKKQVKIYGILDINEDPHGLGFINSHVYNQVIEQTGGLVKNIYSGKINSETYDYTSLLEDISNNIHISMIENLGLNNIPEYINTITLGSLDKDGNFVSKKVLTKEEFQVINGKVSFTEIDSIGEYTHAKIDYYKTKIIE